MKKTPMIIFSFFLAVLFSQITFGALTDSIVSYWKMDSVSGNVNDELGINNLRQSGTVNSVTGKIGTARGTYSDANFFNATTTIPFTGTQNYTLAGWVNWTGTGVYSIMFSAGDNNKAGDSYMMLYRTSANKLGFEVGRSGVSANFTSITNTDTGWHFLAGTFNGSEVRFYYDGVLVNSTNATITTGNQGNILYVGRAGVGTVPATNSIFDELGIWNRTLTPTEIIELNNLGSGLTYPFLGPNISFYSQNPSDITSTSLFSGNVIVTYNISNTTGMSNNFLNLSLSSNRTCLSFLNGSCILANNTKYTIYNTTGTTSLFNYSLGENMIYPLDEWLSYTNYAQTHISTNINTNNEYFNIQFINVSNVTQYNFFEVMANSTGVATVYYCNSSYSTGNVAVNTNCTQIFSGILDYNHTHSIYQKHALIVFSINNSKIGNVAVTPISQFIIRGGNTNIYSVTNLTGRTNIFKISINNGNTYTDVSTSQTPDTHLHQFTGTDILSYYGCVNKSEVYECTSTTTDNLDLTAQKPIGVQIYTPNSSTYNQYINITYLIQTHPNSPTINNSAIKIDLLNSDYSFNQTIRYNALNTSYYWNTYDYNLSVNTNYYLNITINDTTNAKTNTVSDAFNFSTNSLLNITVKNNTLIYDDFTLNITNLNTSEFFSYNTTIGTIMLDVIKNNVYEIYLIPESTSFSRYYTNFTPVNATQTLILYLYDRNSINISFFEEISKDAFSTPTYPNVSLYIYDNTTSYYNTSITTGNYYVAFLSAGEYNIRYSADNYLERIYYYTINDYSTNNIMLYLINNTISSTVKLNIKDIYGNIIEGAVIKLLRYYPDTNSYEQVEMTKTNNNGNGYLQIQLATTENNGEYYKFIIEIGGVVYLETTPSKIYDTTLNFNIATTESTLIQYNNNLKLYYDLSFNNNTDNFRLTWDNGFGNFVGACLKVYLISLSGTTLYNSNCVYSSSGSILINIDNSSEYLYEAKAFAYYDDYELFLASLTQKYDDVKQILGKNGLFFAMILIICFALLGIYNLYVSVILTIVGLIMVSLFGLMTIGWTIMMGIICIGFFIVLMRRNA